MKIPCVCSEGSHTFNAHEMTDIIGAFQRGELQRVRWVKGDTSGIYPVCLALADFNAGKSQVPTFCGVLLEDGSTCVLARGHQNGKHTAEPLKGRNRN